MQEDVSYDGNELVEGTEEQDCGSEVASLGVDTQACLGGSYVGSLNSSTQTL